MRLLILALLLGCIASPAWSDTAVPPLSPPPKAASTVPCRSIADCWLDESGNAIKRPPRFRWRAIPRGDCDNRLEWLRNRLACINHVCVVAVVGDRC